MALGLERARRPVMVICSQAVLDPSVADAVVRAVKRLGIPVFLSGTARGLLGRTHPLQQRHQRRQALKEADCVLLAGVPTDFRLDCGNHIPRRSVYVSLNRSRDDLTRNRRPDIGILGDVATSLRRCVASPSFSRRRTGGAARDGCCGSGIAAQGAPVLVNAHLGRSEFRKGSISM